MARLMTDAEVEEIRRQVGNEAAPRNVLRSWLRKLLEDRDARRELERERKR